MVYSHIITPNQQIIGLAGDYIKPVHSFEIMSGGINRLLTTLHRRMVNKPSVQVRPGRGS